MLKKPPAWAAILCMAGAVLAEPYNPANSKRGLSLVFLESEINQVVAEFTSKSVFGFANTPVRFNWNETIDLAIAWRAANGGCSAECYAMQKLKIPFSPNVFVPIYFRIKSLQFEFGADGKIFVDANIGVNITEEVANLSIRLEGSGQLAQYSPLELQTHAQTGKPKSTAEMMTATLKFCPDQLATKVKLTAFNLTYSNSILRQVMMEKVQAELDRIIADKGANCHVLTEKLAPPPAIYGRGMRLGYPSIKVSDGVLELRSTVIDYGPVSSIVGTLLN